MDNNFRRRDTGKYGGQVSGRYAWDDSYIVSMTPRYQIQNKSDIHSRESKIYRRQDDTNEYTYVRKKTVDYDRCTIWTQQRYTRHINVSKYVHLHVSVSPVTQDLFRIHPYAYVPILSLYIHIIHTVCPYPGRHPAYFICALILHMHFVISDLASDGQ